MFDRLQALPDDLKRARMSAGGYAALSPRFASTAIGAAILQLAAGRVPPALKSQALSPMELTEVTAAAQAYVAHVMLAPSSDLLGILGVADDFTPGELRDNYRRLMALVHPDARPVGFPDDAASRVNKAFATLSDDATRDAYLDRYRTLAQPVHRAQASRAAASPLATPRRRGVGQRFAALRVATVRALATSRPRTVLLWCAAILLLPVLAVVGMTVRFESDVNLVQARPKSMAPDVAVRPAAEPATAAPPPSVAAALTTVIVPRPTIESASPAPLAAAATPEPVTQKAAPPPVITPALTPAIATAAPSAGSAVARLTAPGTVPPVAASSISPTPVPTPTLQSRPVAPPAIPTVAAVAAAPAAAGIRPDPLPARRVGVEPTPSPRVDTAGNQRLSVAVPAPPPIAVAATPATVPVALLQPPAAVMATPAPVAAPPLPQQAQQAATAPTVVTVAQRGPSLAAEREQLLVARKIDELLARFSNAYEAGSVDALQQLLSPTMTTRRPVLADYERVFRGSQGRNIRFAQMKYVNTPSRLASVGTALVTITYPDNRVVTQRVFLEMDFVHHRDDLLIDRLANHAVD